MNHPRKISFSASPLTQPPSLLAMRSLPLLLLTVLFVLSQGKVLGFNCVEVLLRTGKKQWEKYQVAR